LPPTRCLIVAGCGDHEARARPLLSEQDAPNLAAEFDTVLANPSYRRNAGLVAGEIADLPSAGEVWRELASAT
jgi:hypothetical protein